MLNHNAGGQLVRISPFILFLTLLAFAEPALAATKIPEPSDLGLFLLGVAGLIIGRQGAKALKSRDDDSAA